jgi:large subunit ribosomal protein L6
MSRIGKKPVALPNGVSATIDGQTVSVKGPKGELAVTIVKECSVEMGADGIQVTPRGQDKRSRSMWGMSRTLVNNIVVGVSQGFERKLELNGVGYRASLQGANLQLALGYSNDVIYPVPADVSIAVPKPTEIIISGIDKQRVGQTAAEIREFRSPEPYKGKGVKYAEEFIFRKEGKNK